jgi:hypothetical protein
MRRAIRTSRALAAAALLLAVGCRRAPAPVDVAGKIEFTVPRPNATLVLNLHPLEDANKSSMPTAVVEPDGRFKLERCVPGRYKATLVVAQAASGANPPAAPGGAGAAPSGPTTSGLPAAYFD